ncbi:MAG: hypothetical protein KY476_05810 [Planctomycetes bacterium]|nr:hypothetical protein [Planctomycetota bacterium]
MTTCGLTRRGWLKAACAAGVAGPRLLTRRLAAGEDAPAEVIEIGSRRELFVDDLVVGSFDGTKRKLHEPQLLRPHGKVRPHGHYATVLKDGERYRLYYRGDKVPGLHWRNGWGRYHENEITEYAESPDGYQWTEPDLNLYEIDGIPEGNVVLADEFLVTHNFSPFIDERPGVPGDERYKALGGGRYPLPNWPNWQPGEREQLREKHGPGGLYAFASGDGIHWRKLQSEPVVPEDWGNFDSQNVAFWSEAEQQYVCYYRWSAKGLRSIRRSTSQDFLHWSEPVDMEANLPGEHLYTSGTHPYYRAPHIYIALPTRFQAKRSSITDVVFMSSRPGSSRFDRTFKEAFIRPGLGTRGWGNRSNYITWHVVPTGEREMSLYMYGGGHYVLRPDGFISVNAGYAEGQFVTKPLRFTGKRLEVNYSTSAAGGIRIELLDAAGRPLEGFALEDSELLYGDEIDRTVAWKAGSDLGRAEGQAVSLRFTMNEADVYSFRFF